MKPERNPLTPAERAELLADPAVAALPPLVAAAQAAALLRVSKSTVGRR